MLVSIELLQFYEVYGLFLVGFPELVILIRRYLQLALQRVVVYLHPLVLLGQLLEVRE